MSNPPTIPPIPPTSSTAQATPPAETDPPSMSRARRARPLLFWLVVGSLLLHIVLSAVLQPWARTTMTFSEEQEGDRVELVAQREQIRKELEDQQRQAIPLPKAFREQMKKEAERKERDEIRAKVRRLLENRDLAEKQREKALEMLQERSKEEFIQKHLVSKIEEALRDTDKLVAKLKETKPEEAKDAEEKKLDERAEKLAQELNQKLKELQEEPLKAKEKLEEIDDKAKELRKLANEVGKQEKEFEQSAEELTSKSNDIKKAVAQAEKKLEEAASLHDVSQAADVAPAPEVARQAGGEPTAEEKQKKVGEAGDKAEKAEAAKAGQAGSKAQKAQAAGGASAGKQPNTAELYDAAKELEKQTEALVNDARAAELAQRSETSFGTAQSKLTLASPDRPDLAPGLRQEASTVGALNEYRQTLQQASAQIESMAIRTAAMTQGVQAVQNHAAIRASAAGSAASPPGTNSGEGELGEGTSLGMGSGAMGNSSGLRHGFSAFDGGDVEPGKQKSQMQLPKKMVAANALPGRMLTDASARQGWLYLDTWYVIGPWKVNYRDKFGQPHPPEYEIDLDAIYTDGKFADEPDHPYHKMRWQFVQSDEMLLQTPEVFGAETWYAYTEIYSDRTRDMLLAVASDDFAKVWLNNVVVWQDEQQSAYDMGEALREVTFEQGFNRLLIRIGNGPGPLAWSVLISPPEILNYLKPTSPAE